MTVACFPVPCTHLLGSFCPHSDTVRELVAIHRVSILTCLCLAGLSMTLFPKKLTGTYGYLLELLSLACLTYHLSISPQSSGRIFDPSVKSLPLFPHRCAPFWNVSVLGDSCPTWVHPRPYARVNEFWLQKCVTHHGPGVWSARKNSCVLFLAWGDGERKGHAISCPVDLKKKNILHQVFIGLIFCAGKYVMYEVCNVVFLFCFSCHRLAWVLFEARGIVSV